MAAEVGFLQKPPGVGETGHSVSCVDAGSEPGARPGSSLPNKRDRVLPGEVPDAESLLLGPD